VIYKEIVLVGVESKDGQKVVITRPSSEGTTCITLAKSGGEVRNVKVVGGIEVQSGHGTLTDVEVIGGEGGVAVRANASISALRCTFRGGLVPAWW